MRPLFGSVAQAQAASLAVGENGYVVAAAAAAFDASAAPRAKLLQPTAAERALAIDVGPGAADNRLSRQSLLRLGDEYFRNVAPSSVAEVRLPPSEHRTGHFKVGFAGTETTPFISCTYNAPPKPPAPPPLPPWPALAPLSDCALGAAYIARNAYGKSFTADVGLRSWSKGAIVEVDFAPLPAPAVADVTDCYGCEVVEAPPPKGKATDRKATDRKASDKKASASGDTSGKGAGAGTVLRLRLTAGAGGA